MEMYAIGKDLPCLVWSYLNLVLQLIGLLGGIVDRSELWLLREQLVMSTPAYVDSKTITQADEAQSFRVPVPLPDDPYVAVRQAYEEFEAFEPSGTTTISSHSSVSSDSTAPLSPDHPLTHVSPTPTPT
ncbi:hypothetical protein Tco_0156028 [Tanacetum coccineum]